MALLQNELNSDVVRFTTYVQICLTTTQVVASWRKLLQINLQWANRFFTRFAAMFQNKLYVFVALLNRSFLK